MLNGELRFIPVEEHVIDLSALTRKQSSFCVNIHNTMEM